MNTIGRVIEIQGELFEIVRTLRVGMGKVLPTDFSNEIKDAWHAERVFKQNDQYFFVNEIKTIETKITFYTNTMNKLIENLK